MGVTLTTLNKLRYDPEAADSLIERDKTRGVTSANKTFFSESTIYDLLFCEVDLQSSSAKALYTILYLIIY